eukprot:5129170-Prorocentrum_lima.AAC.1
MEDQVVRVLTYIFVSDGKNMIAFNNDRHCNICAILSAFAQILGAPCKTWITTGAQGMIQQHGATRVALRTMVLQQRRDRNMEH